MSPTVFFGILFLLAFLFAVNTYLRGSWTKLIERWLFAIMYGWAFSAFYFLNWKWGLVALVAPFVFVAVLVPIARALASLAVRGPLRHPLD